MPDFVPNSTVILLSNVPLDNTYQNTLTFASSIAQQGYFQSKAISGMTFSGLTYQRTDRALRAEVNVEQLWNCNYLMFQNTNFGSKWFYAFVTNVEFRGQNVTYVYFEIDVMQTWAFDYSLKPCFVEREHVNDDAIGLHTLPENLELGPYVTTAITSVTAGSIENYALVSEVVDEAGVSWVSTGEVNGMIMGAYWAPLNAINVYGILDAYGEAGKLDAIVGIYGYAQPFFSWSPFSPLVQSFSGAARTLTYTPKNNKLYTYPYCVCTFICNGQAEELRYENFSGGPTFEYVCSSFVNPQVTGYPTNYEGETKAVELTLSFSNVMISPFVKNSFQNWLAQNKSTLQTETMIDSISLLGASLNAMPSVVTGNFGAVQSAVNQGISVLENTAMRMAKIEDKKAIPNTLGGSLYGGDSLILSGAAGFYSYCRAIKPEYAKMIDDYFSMFGYKVNAVKVPNITGRESWNYVKTVSANIVGAIPFNTISQIKGIFDKGITFWHGDYVGDYTRSNNIVTTN